MRFHCDKDRKTLFIIANTSLYSIQIQTKKPKLILCLALVLVVNCHVAIIFPEAPEERCPFASNKISEVIQNFPHIQKGLKVEDLTTTNVDSVETGQGGKEQIPHDQDEDWSSAPYFPEVAAGMRSLSALAKTDRLDLHNPGYGARDIDFYIAPLPLLPPERVANEDNFFDIVKEQMTGSIKFNGRIGPDGKTYDPAVDKSVDAWVAAQSLPYVVSLTMEIPWNISASPQDGSLKVGAQLGRSVDLYLQPAIRSGSQK